MASLSIGSVTVNDAGQVTAGSGYALFLYQQRVATLAMGSEPPPIYTAAQLTEYMAAFPGHVPPTWPTPPPSTKPAGLSDAAWAAAISRGFVAQAPSAAAQLVNAKKALATQCHKEAGEIIGYLISAGL